MRKTTGPMRAGAASPSQRIAGHRAGTANIGRPTISAAGGISFIILAVLYWLIIYQNLPDGMGLHGPLAPGVVVAITDQDITSANTIDRIIKVCVIAMSVYVICTRWSLTRAVGKNVNVGAAAFMMLAPLSALWSISPPDTILRYISLLAIVLLCFAISLAGWHPRRFQQLTLPPVMFILVTSLVLGMIYPTEIKELGDDLSLKDAWHGITLTKNQFGMTASLGVILCMNRWLAREGRAVWVMAGAAVSMVCLILSRSNTSLFATMLAVLSMVLVMRVPIIAHRYCTHVVVAIAGTLLLYELVIQDVVPGSYVLLAPIRALTGKDATFSARTVIWDIIKDHIRLAPYLGTGYAAYWLGPIATSPSFIFTWKMYFYPTEAHNGYLDIVNDLGLVGLLCVLVFLFAYMRQALQLMKHDRAQAALYLAILFHQMIMNMSESEWFARDTISIVLLLSIACLTRGLREARLNASS